MRRRPEHAVLDVLERQVVDRRVAGLLEHERPVGLRDGAPAEADGHGGAGRGDGDRVVRARDEDTLLGHGGATSGGRRGFPSAARRSGATHKSPRRRSRVSRIDASLVRGHATSTRTDRARSRARTAVRRPGWAAREFRGASQTRGDSIAQERAPVGREWHDPLMPRRTSLRRALLTLLATLALALAALTVVGSASTSASAAPPPSVVLRPGATQLEVLNATPGQHLELRRRRRLGGRHGHGRRPGQLRVADAEARHLQRPRRRRPRGRPRPGAEVTGLRRAGPRPVVLRQPDADAGLERRRAGREVGLQRDRDP